ncbi:MAG TPA: Bax inhibitor-1/YccA family protein [Sphingomonas sp.]|nr:Bax inhibitor-1/YccA family protein [Sphingomonas sp.]
MENIWRVPNTTAARHDAGLRRHMVGIYRNMALGLLVTGGVAFGVSSSPALTAAIFGTPLKWVAMLAPLAFIMFFSFRVERMTTASARLAFFGFSAVMGVSMASLFLTFTGISIAQTFLIAATMFASVSLWGYTTGRNLAGWGSFLMMGVIGVVIASLINIFLGSNMLHLIISLIGVAVFTALTAWDTQRAKSEYLAYAGTEAVEKLAVMSALGLYLNLINMFQLLLSFTGQRND